MLCKKPYFRGALPYGCGQCTPCRVNKKRLWIHRLVLENWMHSDASFITLTYSDEKLPVNGTLVPEHVTKFLKLVRRRSGLKLRYFLVGEYGELSERPHYHLLLFGFPTCAYGRTQHGVRRSCCAACDLVSHAWGKGFVDLGTVTKDSIDYCSGYVTKKMTRKNNDFQKAYLGDRVPEFARMSLKPGIGALAIDSIADAFKPDYGFKILQNNNGDVPVSLTHGSKSMPLGRYLRGKLRNVLAIPEKGEREKLSDYAASLREMYAKAGYGEEVASYKKTTVQKILNLEARFKIHKKGPKL